MESRRPLALITGASAGLGACFARALAQRGHDLILVARGADRLQALATELQGEQGASVEILVADLGDGPDLARVEDRVAKVQLDLLVNNAGFGHGKSFLEVDGAAHDAMLRVHLGATFRLTRAALPAMVARGKGGVINVASVAGFLPRAGSVTYGATKSCLIFFSQALATELVGTGVEIQALCPGLTHTEFHARARMVTTGKPSWLWMGAQDVVDCSLRCLRKGRVVCVPGFKNRLFVALSRWAPTALVGAVVRRTDST